MESLNLRVGITNNWKLSCVWYQIHHRIEIRNKNKIINRNKNRIEFEIRGYHTCISSQMSLIFENIKPFSDFSTPPPLYLDNRLSVTMACKKEYKGVGKGFLKISFIGGSHS